MSGVLTNTGGDYAMLATDFVKIVIEGDLSAIKEILWDSEDDSGGGAITLESTDSDFNITNGVATFKIKGDNGTLDATNVNIRITVEGDQVIAPRTLTITVQLDFTDGDGGLNNNDRDLVAKADMTVWKLNGTVLIAN